MLDHKLACNHLGNRQRFDSESLLIKSKSETSTFNFTFNHFLEGCDYYFIDKILFRFLKKKQSGRLTNISICLQLNNQYRKIINKAVININGDGVELKNPFPIMLTDKFNIKINYSSFNAGNDKEIYCELQGSFT